MATIFSVTWTQFVQIRGKVDNIITEYRDFATDGVPGSPANGDVYLAETSGSGFTIGKIYVYSGGVFYAADPPQGDYFNDGSILYQIDGTGAVLTLGDGIYNNLVNGPLDMNSTGINELTSLNAPSGQNSIGSSPISYNSYSVSNIGSTINNLALNAATVTSISGFSSVSSTYVGNISTGTGFFTVAANGNYAIHLDAVQDPPNAAILTLELSDATTGRVLDDGASFGNGAGVGTNYSGFLAGSDVVQARILSNIATNVDVTLSILRLS